MPAAPRTRRDVAKGGGVTGDAAAVSGGDATGVAESGGVATDGEATRQVRITTARVPKITSFWAARDTIMHTGHMSGPIAVLKPAPPEA